MPRCRNSGIALIEILIACICLAAVSTAALTALAFTGRGANDAAQRMVVLNAAESRLESAKAAGAAGALSTGSLSETLTIAGVPSQVSIVTQRTAVGGKPGLFDVNVTATWTGSRSQAVALETLIRNGIS